MKKLIITLSVCLAGIICFTANAQTGSETVKVERASKSYYYVEVMENPLIDKLSHVIKTRVVSINLGKIPPFGAQYKITDESGKNEIRFENAMGAVNYLGAMGWEVVSIYQQPDVSTYQTHYLLRRDASLPSTCLTRFIDETIASTPLAAIQ